RGKEDAVAKDGSAVKCAVTQGDDKWRAVDDIRRPSGNSNLLLIDLEAYRSLVLEAGDERAVSEEYGSIETDVLVDVCPRVPRAGSGDKGEALGESEWHVRGRASGVDEIDDGGDGLLHDQKIVQKIGCKKLFAAALTRRPRTSATVMGGLRVTLREPPVGRGN